MEEKRSHNDKVVKAKQSASQFWSKQNIELARKMMGITGKERREKRK